MVPPVPSWTRLLMAAVLVSVIAGGVSGWFGARAAVSPSIARLEDSLREALPLVESRRVASTTVEIVPVQPPVGAQGVPAALRVGRASPTLPLFRLEARASDELLFPTESLAPAVALTADGWLAAPIGAFPATARLSEFGVGWKGELRVPVKGIRDVSTGLAFLKIDARDLPVAPLVSRFEVEVGEPVWRESRADQYLPSVVAHVGTTTSGNAVLSSDQWNRRFLLSGFADAPAAVWNARGQLVGLTGTGAALNAVVPADAIRTGLASLLATGDVRRPTLGVHYLDLSERYARSGGPALPASGALLKGERKNVSGIVANGPAAQALRDGDIIERIDRDVLDGTWTLAERVFEYRPGASVTIAGQRQGKPFVASVTFGSQTIGEMSR